MLDYRLNLGRAHIQRKPSMTNQCFTLILHPILVAVWPNDYFYASRIIDAILIKNILLQFMNKKSKC